MKGKEELRISAVSRALQRSLKRALRNQKRARKKLDATPVHDFRVALRRCRSLAEGLSAIDSHRVWRRLRKVSKRQQKGLSELRDVQVLQGWLKPLRLTTGPVGRALTAELKKQQRSAKRKARTSLKSFPRHRWKNWLLRLPARVESIPLEERRVARLVVEQLTRVVELHNRWSKELTPEAWHALRLNVKRLRYMLESFLPEKNAAWKADLVSAQDLLGEGHDLDVLRALVAKLAGQKSLRHAKAEVRRCLRRVEGEAQRRREGYASLVVPGSEIAVGTAPASDGQDDRSLWVRWRAELLQKNSVSRRAGEGPLRSKARRALHAEAKESRYPSRPRRISSTQ